MLRTLSRDPKLALDLGKAAEHLVCADLILNGYRCYLSDQGLSYDIVVDVNGMFCRVQVKACCFPRNMNGGGKHARIGYTFHVRRRGKNQRGKRLDASHCDIVALVAIDIGAIAYLPLKEVGQTYQLMPPGYGFPGRYKRTRGVPIDQFPFSAALQRLGRAS
jgi:hypothetical protein